MGGGGGGGGGGAETTKKILTTRYSPSDCHVRSPPAPLPDHCYRQQIRFLLYMVQSDTAIGHIVY